MHDAPLVGVFECVGDLKQNLFGFRGRDRCLRNAVGQGWSRDQLHDQGSIFDTVYRRDALVVEMSQHLGFALKAHQTLEIARQSIRQDFNRYFAGELGIQGFVNLAHTAGADGFKNFVGSQAGSGNQGHSGVERFYLTHTGSDMMSW